MRRVIEPLLSGGDERDFSARDLEYVRDLGLIAREDPPRIANPIYAEIVPRELNYFAQAGLVQDTAWYVKADGSLDLVELLTAFQTFFREHSEHWVERFEYKEARAATALASVFTARGEQRWPHRTRIRPGPWAHGLAHRLAPRGSDAPFRGRMQNSAQESGGKSIAEGIEQTADYNGPLRGRGGPSRDL